MENAFRHHGILGMKWGVRRTPAQLGRKSARSDDDSGSDKSQSGGGSKSGGTGRKRSSEMSDNELQSALKRMRMEEDYDRLMGQRNAQKESPVRKALAYAGPYLAKQTFQAAANNLAQRVGGSMFKEKKKGFDVSDFDFRDTSKVDTKKLQEAVQWYSLNTKYEDLRAAYKKK